MLLTNTQLQKIYHGALHFRETKDGYLQAFQHTDAQMKYFKEVSEFWFERCDASTAKTIEFETTATKFSFDYKIIWIGSPDSFEVAVNGLITNITYIKDIAEEGSLSFDLPEGSKQITLYLPADSTVLLRHFDIGGDYTEVQKNAKVLWLGDSITQGFGPLRSGHTYVSIANRLLNYDIINQGIGGYIYDKNILMDLGSYKPDKIIVALGTNQYGTETMKDIEDYYIRLRELYGDTPVLCITPLWRGDSEDGEPTLIRFCENLKKICRQYSNITIIDGFTLIPHLPEYFLDNLHPNCLGCEVYGRNLVRAIEETGF